MQLSAAPLKQAPNPNMKILHSADEIKPFFFIQPSAYNSPIAFRHPDFLMDF
jgi:hypothetical protein